MSKGLIALRTLKKGDYGTIEVFREKLTVIERELKVLDIIMKYVDIQKNYDDMFPYTIVDKQYVSNRSELVISDKEFELFKEVSKCQ